MAIISTALPTSSAVDVENLTFSYQRNCLNLEDINMHVPRGTIYGLLGPSGCGKTTLLRCIVGRLKPRCGHVAVFGYRPGTKECGIPGPNIGYMPQELSLISQFTVRETLEYYAGFAKQNAHQQSLDARIEFLLKLLDISEFEHIYTDRLSGGQQRRVSLAVAMINDPPLLILDEPTVGVDPIVRESIWSYLVDQSKNGLTVIVTTHYIEEAGSADKVGFMRQGRILAEGNPNYLMLQHNVSSMERLFLKLSQQDDFRHQDYPKDILLQLEAKHRFSSKHNESTKNGQKASDQSSEKSMDPQTVVYTNGSASFVKTKPSALLALSPPMPPTQQQKQQLSAAVSPNSNHSHNNHNQKSQHTIMVEQYKQLDPDSLIETPIAPDASTTNSFHNNNNNNNNNCKLNNNDYHETASDSPLFNNNCSSSSSSSSSTTSSRQKKSTKSPSSNTSGREMRTYSVHGHDRSVNSIQKIGVLCRKHRIRLFRRVPELVITMLLPALEVALFCLCMGRDPTSVQMAVCNQENPPFLSLLFLKSIDSDFISLKYYKTPEEAIDSVRNADTYSAIVLAKNFSTLLKQFGQHGGGPPGLMQPLGLGNNHNRQQQLSQNRVQTVTLAHRQPSTLSTTTAPTPPPSSMYTTTTSSTTSMINQKNRSKSVTNTNQPMPPLMTPFIPPSQPTQSMLKTTGGNIDGDHGDGGTGLRRVRRNISDFVATTMITPKSMQQPTDMDKNNDDDEETIIRIYYDGSNALHVNIIRREVFSALFRFIDTASKTLGGGLGHGYKLPIKFEKPIYGGEKTDMVEFVGPGLMVFIVFFATMSITSMAFLSERREGTLERSMIVGMTPTEFIIAQIINITFLLIVQIILTVVMGFWIFDFPMKGSYVLAVTMMFLQGLCGMTFGLMLSAICTSEMTALALGAGSQLMFCFITGIFWPVETMIALLRYISYAMPQTKPMESFRHILIRGFDLSKPAVLNGYLITLAWIGFFLIVAIVIFRVR